MEFNSKVTGWLHIVHVSSDFYSETRAKHSREYSLNARQKKPQVVAKFLHLRLRLGQWVRASSHYSKCNFAPYTWSKLVYGILMREFCSCAEGAKVIMFWQMNSTSADEPDLCEYKH